MDDSDKPGAGPGRWREWEASEEEAVGVKDLNKTTFCSAEPVTVETTNIK